MEHLKLYEAFMSKSISGLDKFLKDTISIPQSIIFKKEVRRLMSNYDIPIDKIEDKDIKYLKTKTAIKVKPPEDWKQPKDTIYALKFWGSIEKGLLGVTGIGDKKIEPISLEQHTNGRFDIHELRTIKNKLVAKGELCTVNDYSLLKTGDVVIAILDDDIVKGRIFIDDQDDKFIIQNERDGTHPGNTIEWQQYGNFGWIISSVDYIEEDHKNLCYYRSTEENLHYVESFEIKDDEEDPLTYNLPLNLTGKLTRWNSSNKDMMKNSDFCFMFLINDIKNNTSSVSDIRTKRLKEKEGAVKLWTDEKVLNDNIERFMYKIIMKNLEKLLKLIICGKYPIYAIFSNMKAIEKLNKLMEHIYNMMSQESSKQYYFDKTKEIFEKLKERIPTIRKKFRESEEYGLSTDITNEYFTLLIDMNNIITEYIEKLNIKTISDLRSVFLKLQQVHNMFLDSYMGNLRWIKIIKSMDKLNQVMILSRLNDSDVESDIKKLKNIKRYIKEIFPS